MFWHMSPLQSCGVIFLSVAIPVAVAAVTHALRSKKPGPPPASHVHEDKRANVSPIGHTDA